MGRAASGSPLDSRQPTAGSELHRLNVDSHHTFWQRRAQDQPKVKSQKSKVKISDEAQDQNPRERSRKIVSQLDLAPEVTITRRPVIEGPFVELRDVVVTPLHPRGIRFLDNICLPPLLKIVAQHQALSRIIPAYHLKF